MLWHKVRSILGVLVIISIPFCSQTSTPSKAVYSPVYMSYTDLRNSYSYDTTTVYEVRKAGKMYYYNNYLFVNEVNKGIHVINVLDPANPTRAGFINLPGNVDIAIKNDVMYADSYVDLVVIDISPLLSGGNPVLIQRINDMFPYPYYYANDMMYVDTGYYFNDTSVIFNTIDTALGIVIGWVYSNQQVIADTAAAACNLFNPIGLEIMPGMADSSTGGATTGTGGSLARFIIVNNATSYYLYTLNHTNLNIVNITTDPTATSTPLTIASTFPVGWEISSLFVDGNNLFISSATDIGIYSIGGTFGGSLTSPAYLSTYVHNVGCSPVIASGNYMYTTKNTVASGSCYNMVNSVDVIDISNIYSPNPIATRYDVDSPYGLGRDTASGVLVVADGVFGLKFFDTTTLPASLTPIGTMASPTIAGGGIEVLKDIILIPPTAFLVGEHGIYIYDMTNIATGSFGSGPLGNIQIVP